MAKQIVTIFGVIFLIIGIWGFFQNPILGLFEVDTVHNIIHLLSGAAALALAAQGEAGARMFAKVFGVVYGLVTVLGFIMGEGELLGLMHINMADNFLHLLLSLVFLYVGFARTPQTT